MNGKLTTAHVALINAACRRKGVGSQEVLTIMQACESNMKDKTLAYILGALFGCFGIHRIYCGQIGLGIFQFITVLFFGIGLIWVLADVFLTSGLVDSVNDTIVNETVVQYSAIY